MDKKCINCRYFKLGSVGPARKEHVWGDCLRIKKDSRRGKNPNSIVNFTWADACCGHFEPVEPAEQGRQDSDSE